MNMKNFKHITKSGIILFLAALSITACTEKNDWDVDDSHNRVFSITKMGVVTKETEVEFSWIGIEGAEYYIIEISNDSLYNDIEMGEHESAIVYGEDKSITTSPAILSELESSTKYFLRAKAMSATKLDSKWTYLDGYSFKTKSEQIMEAVGSTDKTISSVTLRWEAGAKVTHIELLKGEDPIREIPLSSEEIEAGTITIEGLDASTVYTANLYNNEIKRGYATFQTHADVPPADYIAYLAENDSINGDLFDELAAGGYKNVTIVLPANTAFYNKNTIKLPDDMSITFFGLAGEKQPIIGVNGMTLASKHGFIKFENIDLTGFCIDGEGNQTQNNYLFNQSDATSVGNLEFENCIIRNFVNSPLRMQGTATKIIDKLIINNCIIYGATSRTYSIIHVDANSGSGRIENFEVTNSTVMYSGKCFIYCRNYNATSIKVKNCTFSKLPWTGDYFIDSGDVKYGPTQGTILENNIFGSTVSSSSKGIRCAGALSIMNCYATSDWDTSKGGNSISGLLPYSGTENDLFEDPENAKFTIIDNFFEGKRSCGDPRWYMPE